MISTIVTGLTLAFFVLGLVGVLVTLYLVMNRS